MARGSTKINRPGLKTNAELRANCNNKNVGSIPPQQVLARHKFAIHCMALKKKASPNGDLGLSSVLARLAITTRYPASRYLGISRPRRVAAMPPARYARRLGVRLGWGAGESAHCRRLRVVSGSNKVLHAPKHCLVSASNDERPQPEKKCTHPHDMLSSLNESLEAARCIAARRAVTRRSGFPTKNLGYFSLPIGSCAQAR